MITAVVVLASAADNISLQLNSRLKRVGPKTQPCFMPFVTGKGSDFLPFSMTLAIMPSCRNRTMPENLGGQPSLDRADQKPGLLTVWNALVRSINRMYRSWCFSEFLL